MFVYSLHFLYSFPFVLQCHVALSSQCVSSSYLLVINLQKSRRKAEVADLLCLLFYTALSQHLFKPNGNIPNFHFHTSFVLWQDLWMVPPHFDGKLAAGHWA